jgi:actin beta/gamma 1
MDSEEDESPTSNVIIDNGTGYCKVGLSCDEAPRSIFPSCVGYAKYESGMIYSGQKEFYIGHDAVYKKGVLKLNYPIEHGVVNNWDDMEKIWGHAFTNELRVAPEEHNVMLTEAPLNPKENREKMAQIMFETFNVPGLYISIQAVLSLYSAGKVIGIVLDSGDGVTHFVPIFESYSLPHAILRFDCAGRDLTEYMVKLLTEVGQRFYTTAEKEIAKSIKEKSCYSALDFEEEKSKVESYDYELPDGTHIILRDQRIRCPEALFSPSLIGIEGPGIAELCCNSIQRCDIDLRRDLYYNILLSGGNSTISGLSERLSKEIKKILEGKITTIRVLPTKEMNKEKKDEDEEGEKKIKSYDIKYAVWQGGAVASKLDSFKSNWITKEEYEEYGATILHRKCF